SEQRRGSPCRKGRRCRRGVVRDSSPPGCQPPDRPADPQPPASHPAKGGRWRSIERKRSGTRALERWRPDRRWHSRSARSERAPAASELLSCYDCTMVTKSIERVQSGIRIEKRTLKVLKGLAEYHDLSLGDLLEGIVLHAFEGKAPFGAESRKKIG